MAGDEQALPSSAAPPAKKQPRPTGAAKPPSQHAPMEGAEDAATLIEPIPTDPLARILALTSIFVLPVTFCIVFVLIANTLRQVETECRTEGCRVASHYISTSVAGKLNPCNDFYQYTCQGWKAHYPEHLNAHTTLVNLSEYFSGTGVATENFEKAANTLASCTTSFSKAPDQSINPILNFVNGDLKLNWPRGPAAITVQQVYDVIVKLQLRYNIYPFFALRFNKGLEKLTISAAERHQPWYMRYPDTAKPAFRDALITAVVSAMSLTLDPVVIGQIINVEDELNRVATTSDDYMLAKVKVFSQDEFKLTWNMMNAVYAYLPDAKRRIFLQKTKVHAKQPMALRAISIMLNWPGNASAVANYIAWAVIDILGRRTSRSIRQAILAVSNQHGVAGIARPSLRPDVCYYETYRLFNLVLDRQMYLRMDDDVSALFHEALKTVKLFVKGILEELYWMDRVTVKRLQKRLDGFTNAIGLLARFKYVDVEDAYDNLPFIDQDEVFTKNYLDIKSKLNERLLEKNFRYKYVPSLWSIVPHVRYVLDHRAFYIPLSVLLKPLFVMNKEFPLALIYGRIIAQAVTEFFVEGYRSHKLRATDAWSDATERQFEIYMDCYNNGFKDATLQLHDPAMAYFRSGALNKAFQMYQLEAYKKGKSYMLLGSNLTAPQLFFVATCLDLCTRVEVEESHLAALCNLPLRRVKAFSRAFRCAPSDRLGHLRMNCSQFRIIKELFAFKFDDIIETSLSVQDDE
ncbi:unnamed protein product [Ixodes hexagonus]